MIYKSLAGIAVLLVANGLVACSIPDAHAPAAPSAPSGVSLPGRTGALVVFKDPLTGLSTSDVRDAQGYVVQFTTPTSSSGSTAPTFPVTRWTALAISCKATLLQLRAAVNS